MRSPEFETSQAGVIDHEGNSVVTAVSIGGHNSRLVGGLAVTSPRSDHHPMVRATASWEVTGLVEPGETGPGCSLACAYCNQKSFDVDPETGEQLAGYIEVNDAGTSLNTRVMVGGKIERSVDPDKLVEELLTSPTYARDGWLILENYNDPGMNWRQTTQLIEMLHEAGHQGPMTLITKSGLPEKYAEKLGELRDKGAKLVGIVSYPGLPKEIEPAPSEPRLNTLRRLRQRNIPTIVSIRPLIEGINFDEETISRIIDETSEYTDFYIAGGLFVFDEWTPQVFEDLGYPLLPEYVQDGYEVAKVAPENIHEVVQNMARSRGKGCIVMPHTSCAIAGLVTIKYGVPTRDRLAHWVDHKNPGTRFESHCSSCPQEQQQVCRGVLENDPEEVLETGRDILRKLGYPNADITLSQVYDGHLLVIDEIPLNFSELAFIRQATGMYVNNLPTLDGLLYRAEEALQEEYGSGVSDFVVGAVLANEDWYIFVDDDIDGKNNANTEKHIRTRARARVKVINLQDLEAGDVYDLLISAGLCEEEAGAQADSILDVYKDNDIRQSYRRDLDTILSRWTDRKL